MENSEANYLEKENKLEWAIEKLDATRTTANLELRTGADLSSLFPFEVRISYPYSILGAQVLKVTTTDTKQPVTYSEKTTLSCESYQIVAEL